MSRLPLQSKAIRPKFQNRRAIFGGDEDEEEQVNDERVLAIEDNQIKEYVEIRFFVYILMLYRAEPKKEVKPLSISPLPNVDWRASAKQKKELFLPARAQQQQQQEQQQTNSGPEVLGQTTTSFGLQIQTKKTLQVVHSNGNLDTVTQTEVTSDAMQSEPVQKTLEERAMEAIIKESLGEDEEEDSGPKKVIPMNETIVFREDVENRPDETSMEDYENIPVDEFGAALLRGLGWSEGEGIGRNRKNSPAPPPPPVKQREALLGLGAKPEEVDTQDRRQKAKNRREAYEYKDTSLFKKISKRRVEDALIDTERSRDSSRSSRDSDRSSRRRYDDDYDDKSRKRSSSSSSSKRRRSRSSDRHSSSRHRHRRSRSRSPSRDSSRHSSRSSRK
ncbi:DExH-box splicing factor binding site-domain-containing protein [Gilbertella persicaria]|uniref:DExH-box splicing factor binding site-domain-containing protein n=1 Tax=Gilbertella persicaria TaxID=101096 RepID=UPI00221FB01D|nr:DExH-box splicing factor binding site-domain-containing protein [Gilbertella persicaria]KAI8082515.1 DExH-box splicing factor binding site-domain-containing protein [Gilbertella persicaria]